MSVVFRLFHFSRAKLLYNLNSCRSASSICTVEDKQNLVKRLLEAKLDSGLTFDEIASRCQITNVHCAQLFHNQARLSPKLAATLKQLVPALQDDDLREMQRCPLRIADPLLMHDPAVYRFHELVVQYGKSLKSLIEEKFGDGIMSAIDFQMTLSEAPGKSGERRVVIRMDGKFLPRVEPTQLD
ncbi:cyanase [Trichinella nativa]|uniref:Cyanase n=1 Tax=Trichinella nativa TaxID=6335 RepID=A0A1Y3EDS9_9BILA|nr:cyanase [Trichinella nativa]